MFRCYRHALCLLLSLALLTCADRLEAEFRDTFESSDPAWRLADADCGAKLIERRRTLRQQHAGSASELLRVSAGYGTYCYATYPIKSAAVIDELNISIWVRSERPGVQLLARVILPRTTDPNNDKPLSILVRGTILSKTGEWQQLTVSNLPTMVDRQSRVLRTQLRSPVDVREAHVDMIALNLYTGAGMSSVWIDDLFVRGEVAHSHAITPAPNANNRSAVSDVVMPIVASEPSLPPPQLRQSKLLAGDRPFFARMVTHHGESFALLHSLGFNVVRLSKPPTAQQLSDAAKHELYLVCPPPTARGPNAITAAHHVVLCWDVQAKNIDAVRRISSAARHADTISMRPQLLSAPTGNETFSRIANILLLNRPQLPQTSSEADYRAWLKAEQSALRPGTPIWATVPIVPPQTLVHQLQWFGVHDAEQLTNPYNLVRRMTFAAIAAGARGIHFQTDSSLEQQDDAAQQRTETLRLLNNELDLIEPWLAGGDRSRGIDHESAEASAYAMETARARLLLVFANPQRRARIAPRQDAITLVYPAANVSHVYHVTGTGLRTLRHQRVAGGVRITVDHPGTIATIVMTQDPLVFHHLSKKAAVNARSSAEAQIAIARRESSEIEALHRQMLQSNRHLPAATAWISLAKTNMARATNLYESHDLQGAATYADRVQQYSLRVRDMYLAEAAKVFPAKSTSPLCLYTRTLPDHWRLAKKMQTALWSSNLFPAGDFEDMQQMIRVGWQRFQLPDGNEQAHVELSPVDPHGGALCLRLQSMSTTGISPLASNAQRTIIVSPATALKTAQMVRLHGWCRVQPAPGKQVTLTIRETLGGDVLDHRFTATANWQPFTFYRMVTRAADVRLEFVLRGDGEAAIDDISLHLVSFPTTRTIPTGQREALIPLRSNLTDVDPARR